MRSPTLYKNQFKCFNDKRGSLSAIDLSEFPKKFFSYKLSSFSLKANTFRGLHYQKKPFRQSKLLFIIEGSIIDYTYNLDTKETLSYEMFPGDALLIPNNYAHGFLTLQDNVRVEYFLDKPFSPEHYAGISYKLVLDDSVQKKIIISEQDQGF